MNIKTDGTHQCINNLIQQTRSTESHCVSDYNVIFATSTKMTWCDTESQAGWVCVCVCVVTTVTEDTSPVAVETASSGPGTDR